MADVGLARVSTLDQDPGLQLDALARAGCAPIYEEKVSGVAAKRPVRDQILGQLRAGDTLTVWDLSRLGRSMIEVVSIVEELDRRGVRFRTLQQPIDTTSPTGKLQLQLLAAVAEYERRMIVERVRAGKARMLAEGRHPGGRALFGFEADHETINEEQAQLLREARDQVLDQGQTLSAVVDAWNAQGLRPGRATHWRVTHLRRILLNKRVVPIIGQEAHDRLRRLLTDQERRKGGRPATYLLSGVLVCQLCSRPMYGARRSRHGVQELTYRCESSGGGRHTGCGRVAVAVGLADDYAREMFISAIVSPVWAGSLAQRQAELLAEDATAEDLDNWRAELDDLDQVQGTRYYTDTMRARHQELRRMTDQATARLMAQPDLQALVDLPRSEEQLRARWSSWSITERRSWLRRLVERIEVKPATSRSRASNVEDRLEPRWLM
ncbi:MAG TPA: recombinase family protein [Actinomycetota bacterium]|jgi:DNA invertase Pin-like site-specific DNA recombinase|nr:recombinase family protein [Actinomycetota bacterium]